MVTSVNFVNRIIEIFKFNDFSFNILECVISLLYAKDWTSKVL